MKEDRESIKRSKCSNLRMIAGNEKYINKFADNGEIKEWVGIGWVTIGTYETLNDVPIDIPIVIN